MVQLFRTCFSDLILLREPEVEERVLTATTRFYLFFVVFLIIWVVKNEHTPHQFGRLKSIVYCAYDDSKQGKDDTVKPSPVRKNLNYVSCFSLVLCHFLRVEVVETHYADNLLWMVL